MNSERAAKIASHHIGVTVEEYVARRESGESWCSGCRTWHPASAFSIDRHRSDGLASKCREANAAYMKTYLRERTCAVCGVASIGHQCARCFATRASYRRLFEGIFRLARKLSFAARRLRDGWRRLARAVAVAARLTARRLRDGWRRLARAVAVAARLVLRFRAGWRRFARCIASVARREIRRLDREAAQELKWTRWALREHRRATKEHDRLKRDLDKRVNRPDYATEFLLSLDSVVPGTDALDGYDSYESRHTLDPIEEVQRARLWQVVGDLDPAMLGERELERLRERLRDEGFAPPPVQAAERERLRDPNRHAGASIAKSKAHGGGKRSRKAQQQVTRDHHVRELTGAQKKQHKQRREAKAA